MTSAARSEPGRPKTHAMNNRCRLSDWLPVAANRVDRVDDTLKDARQGVTGNRENGDHTTEHDDQYQKNGQDTCAVAEGLAQQLDSCPWWATMPSARSTVAVSYVSDLPKW